MDQPEKKTQFNGGAFAVAAILAPGIALAIFYLVFGLAELEPGPGEIGRLIASMLFMLLIVSVWGATPSLAFGALVLAVIQSMPWRGRPTAVVFMIGGVMAAGLYVLAGLGIAGLAPGVAMFFAPWAVPDLWGPEGSRHNWSLVASLLLAGAAAGLIYALYAKRG